MVRLFVIGTEFFEEFSRGTVGWRRPNKGKKSPANGKRKAGVEVVELNLQIANGVTISVKLRLCSVNLGVEVRFAPSIFVEMWKYRFGLTGRGLETPDFADEGLDCYGELFLMLGSALSLGNRSYIVYCSSRIANS